MILRLCKHVFSRNSRWWMRILLKKAFKGVEIVHHWRGTVSLKARHSRYFITIKKVCTYDLLWLILIRFLKNFRGWVALVETHAPMSHTYTRTNLLYFISYSIFFFLIFSFKITKDTYFCFQSFSFTVNVSTWVISFCSFISITGLGKPTVMLIDFDESSGVGKLLCYNEKPTNMLITWLHMQSRCIFKE